MSTAIAPRPPLRALTAERVFVRRSLLHTVRDVESLVMAVVLPTMIMLLFTYVFGGAIESDGSYVQYVVPGIILLCAGFGAASTAVAVSRDMTGGIIERFRTMPLRSGAVITGHAIASLARNLVSTAVVIAVALLVGFRPHADAWAWMLTVALIALYILAFTYLYAAIGLASRSPEAASGYGFALLFLPYLSSAFVPVATMPGWLQPVARYQPITPVIETLRGLLLGTPTGLAPLWAAVWCLAILAASAGGAAWLFRRKAGRR